MDIFEQIKSLNLPHGEYIVIGSGAMSAHGIRSHRDIDLLVTNSLYQELKRLGWQTKQIKPDFEYVEFGIFGASPNMVTLPDYQPNFSELFRNAEIIDGIAFSKLSDVIDFKRALGRDKDLIDIDLIERYLKNT